MSDKDPRKMVTGGFFSEIGVQIRLVIRLMGDRRISPLIKALPIGTLIYLLVPDLVIGPIDDAAIVGLGLYLFVELCPPNIVEEHRNAIIQQMQHDGQEQPEVIDGKFREVDNSAPIDGDSDQDDEIINKKGNSD